MRSKPNRTTTQAPAWLQPEPFPPLSPEPHPCPAEEPVKRLLQQVALLSRKVEYLQTLLFKLMASQLRAGTLDPGIYDHLCCDQCRDELAALVEDGAVDRELN